MWNTAPNLGNCLKNWDTKRWGGRTLTQPKKRVKKEFFTGVECKNNDRNRKREMPSSALGCDALRTKRKHAKGGRRTDKDMWRKPTKTSRKQGNEIGTALSQKKRVTVGGRKHTGTGKGVGMTLKKKEGEQIFPWLADRTDKAWRPHRVNKGIFPRNGKKKGGGLRGIRRGCAKTQYEGRTKERKRERRTQAMWLEGQLRRRKTRPAKKKLRRGVTSKGTSSEKQQKTG